MNTNNARLLVLRLFCSLEQSANRAWAQDLIVYDYMNSSIDLEANNRDFKSGICNTTVTLAAHKLFVHTKFGPHRLFRDLDRFLQVPDLKITAVYPSLKDTKYETNMNSSLRAVIYLSDALCSLQNSMYKVSIAEACC